MSDLEFEFEIPIGDWSNDGHGKCHWFTVVCNRSVEEVRELFFKSKEIEVLKKLIPDEIYSNSYTKISLDQNEELMKLGFHGFDDYNGEVIPYSMQLASYTMWFCSQSDKDLKWDIKEIPMLQFFGKDKNDRHIDNIGYDIFPY